MYPSENFVKCMASFFETVEIFLNDSLHTINVLCKLEQMLQASCLLNFISCSLHAEEIKHNIVYFASRFFLKVHIRERNKIINKSSTSLKKIQKKKYKL